ncbi:ABC transporter permease subunit [Macrococcus equipercicus]|uniref:ABC transporter permease subunit n=1 Tax=Macrococcus equipercicus TaxID=69967 RepID=A0A9Q9BPK7_9STAP|nr:ABC transporter permease subunit [Macrococcus equipercicus]KAA1039199.1 ABC transporter permease subunit [Macrococcus equipercicus]UTH14915.1 ABC transporter permease subunit [Macrococcus equipercicus]
MMMTVLLLSCIPFKSASAQDDQYETIKKRGEIRVGLSADYAPYEFEQTVNGKSEYVGIDIELAKKIAKDLGVKLNVVDMSFDSLLGSMKTGKIDVIISGMSPTPERRKEVDFTDNYMEVTQRMVVQKKNKDKLKSIKDFSGKNIGVQKQTTQEALAQKEIPDANLSSLTRVPEIIMSLNSGKIDGVILEGPVADAYLSKNTGLSYSKLQFADAAKGTAIALPKDSPELLDKLNASIKEVRDQGLIKDYQKKANKAMFEEGSFLSKYGNYFLKGIGATILISIFGVILGSLFGGILAFMKLSRNIIVKAIAWIYIEFVRGTPLLVQVFLVYFGTTAVLGLDLSAFVCGVIALILNCAAYIAEIIRAGINAVDRGQMEAARSLGLSHSQAMNKVIMPQAIKNILPALGNEFITVIKESSIVSVIGVSELMFNAQKVQGASFDPFTPLLIAAVAYFILTFTLSRVMNVFERRMSVSD